ncbi:TOMM precursor leader peptide-binding protein [Sorangium sp. So ce131]|uniref:TOMM precursor leader peptide-binding protein n=1 Tax=Sorangium sp. So ce131 TaxID=3133282 RepID=UPI003F5E6359
MKRLLRFKPHLRVELAGDEQVFLVGERERFLLKGRCHELLAPLLDGRRTELEIVQALEAQASPAEVFYTLITLEKKGYVVEADAGPSPEVEAFWHSLGLDAARAASQLARTPVAVLATGGEDPEPLVAALMGAGVSVRDDAALRVVVARDYLDGEIEVINRRAYGDRSPWMLVKPGGSAAWIGPMFRPGEGPCWECVAQRVRANRPVEAFVARRTGRAEPLTAPRALLPTSARAAADLAALALSRWIVEGGRGAIDERLIEVDLRRFRLEEHAVVRRPQCPVCGDPDLLRKRAMRPIELAPRPKSFTDDGGYRCVTPEETYARHEHLISPITGAVTSVGPVPGRDHPLRPVYGAGYFACPVTQATPPLDEFIRASLGKGRTAAQSRAGALCEALERYSAIFQGDEPRVRASFADLDGEAVHPRLLLGFSESQYARREELNRDVRDWRKKVPPPFDERTVIDWVPAWSLTRGARRYLPAAYCYLHVPAPPGEQLCSIDPNGHAAGNCVEEAILQGLLELAERDAVGIWWYNRVTRPAVDLASFDQPYFGALEEHYRAMGYRLWVLDVTNDLGIPAFAALAHSPGAGRFCIGFGCHLEARLGVQRALTELNQLFEPAASTRAPWGDEDPGDPAFLFPGEGLPARRLRDFDQVSSDDLRDDVRACVERVARLDLEVLALDQTRPDLGLHAVKVVAPGLRHIWPRLGPGRLYEVPVRMGWLRRQLTEAQLNPVPLFL